MGPGIGFFLKTNVNKTTSKARTCRATHLETVKSETDRRESRSLLFCLTGEFIKKKRSPAVGATLPLRWQDLGTLLKVLFFAVLQCGKTCQHGANSYG